jgi:hypothetical protein
MECFSALVLAKDSNGESIFKGRKFTGFTNDEEEAHGLPREVGSPPDYDVDARSRMGPPRTSGFGWRTGSSSSVASLKRRAFSRFVLHEL